MPLESRLSVLSAADSTDWTTVETVREELGLAPTTGTGADAVIDNRLQRRISAVSRRFLKFINCPHIAFQQYLETAIGQADSMLMLRIYPITLINSAEFVNVDVEITGSAGADITIDILLQEPRAGFIFRRFGWIWSPVRGSFLDIRLTETGDQFPGMEEANYRFDYEAGYLMPGQTVPVPTSTVGVPTNLVGTTPEPLPPDLEDAAIAQVKFDWARRGTSADSGIKIKDVGDTKIEFFHVRDQELAQRFGLSPAAFYALNPYRRAA